MAEHTRIKKRNGVYSKVNALNILQFPIPMVVFSLMNQVANDPTHPLYEPMTTQGFLWFPNLTLPDPIGILPVLSAGISFVNII
jgi:membrane protein insertase Oxa1/YidC/SpoIIIJ